MSERIGAALLSLALWLAPQASAAADFVLGGDLEMECHATLSGVIGRGDAAMVARVLEDNPSRQGRPICLDSPGGLWAEGLALMELFHERAIPTAVGAGARCESACAIAFLGGSVEAMTPMPFRARFLHVDGHLGFHAPALEVPQGQYDEATVLAAFNSAMQVVTGLTAWSERLALSDDFLVSLFGTPHDEMYMIDTVGKAAELSVHLVGHVLPRQLTVHMIEQTCRQAMQSVEGEARRFDSGMSIVDAFRIPPTRDGRELGVGVVEHGVSSWLGWYVCSVAYDPPRGPVSAHRLFELHRFEGARDLLFARVSDRPIREWDDPMRQPPPISLSAVLSEVEALGERFSDQEAIRSETVFAAETPIGSMNRPTWHRDQPAPTRGVTGRAAASTQQGDRVPTSLYSSFWDHNGSRMGLVADGSRRQFYYAAPRAALVERGVQAGTLLFEGERRGNTYVGEARIFARPPCGEFTYAVEGPVSSDQRSVTMFGRAPRVNERCQVTSYRDDTLIFTLE